MIERKFIRVRRATHQRSRTFGLVVVLALVALASQSHAKGMLAFTENFNRANSSSLGNAWVEAEGPVPPNAADIRLDNNRALFDLNVGGGAGVDLAHAANVQNAGPAILANFTPRGLCVLNSELAPPADSRPDCVEGSQQSVPLAVGQTFGGLDGLRPPASDRIRFWRRRATRGHDLPDRLLIGQGQKDRTPDHRVQLANLKSL